MKFTAVLFVLLSTVLIVDCLQCRTNSKRNGQITNKRCKKARGIETSPSCGCRIYNDFSSGTYNLKYTYYCLRDSKWCDENTNGLNKCAFYNGTNFEELRCCCDTSTDCCDNFIAEAKKPKENTIQKPIEAKIVANTEENEETSEKTAKAIEKSAQNSAENEKASDKKEEVSEKADEVSEETEEVFEETEEVSEETEEVSEETQEVSEETEEVSSDTETDDSNVSSTTESSEKSQSYTTTASQSTSNQATTTLNEETTSAASSQSETTTAASIQSENVKTTSGQSASATTESTANEGTDYNSVDENVVVEDPIQNSGASGSPNSVDDLNSVRRDEPVHRQQQKSASVAQLSVLLPTVFVLTIFL